MEDLDEYVNYTHKDYYIKHNRDFNTKEVTMENLFYCINCDVELVLNCLKISPKKYGYDYWKSAIFIYIIKEKSHISICKEIYPVIAKNYNKTASSVERAMRVCFENTMFNMSDTNNYICDYIKKFLRIPHNSELLIKLADLIVSDEFQRTKQKYRV